jgi:hypothetical protein
MSAGVDAMGVAVRMAPALARSARLPTRTRLRRASPRCFCRIREREEEGGDPPKLPISGRERDALAQMAEGTGSGAARQAMSRMLMNLTPEYRLRGRAVR